MSVITIIAATQKEIDPLYHEITSNGISMPDGTVQWGGVHFDFCITGIGVIHSMYSILEHLQKQKPDGWIQLGVGGAFDPSLKIGKTYLVHSEIPAGLGVEMHDGSYHSVFDMGWEDPSHFPYSNGVLRCTFRPLFCDIPSASGMTTWYAHGYEETISRVLKSRHGEIEAMEGFPFFFVSLKKGIPFFSLRSISNYVTKRDISSWELDKAIMDLNDTFLSILRQNNFNFQSLFRSEG